MSLRPLSSIVLGLALPLTACGDINVPQDGAGLPGGNGGNVLVPDEPLKAPTDMALWITFDQEVDDDGPHDLEIEEGKSKGEFVTDRFGYGERAYDFAAAGNGVYYGLLRVPDLDFDGDMTMAIWIKGGSQGNVRRIMGIGWGPELYFDRLDVAFGRRGPGTSAVRTPHEGSEWVFYAATVQTDEQTGRADMTLYKDGVPVDGLDIDADELEHPDHDDCVFFIGGDPQSGDQCAGHPDGFKLAATVDDLRVYDRALSADEVAALYAEGNEVPPAPGLESD